MVFPMGCFYRCLKKKKDIMGLKRHWVFMEYEGRNRRVEEYLWWVMLVAKVLESQSC